LTSRGEDEVAIEAVGASKDVRRRRDVVAERAERTRGGRGPCGGRVPSAREPVAVPRGLGRILRVAGDLVLETGREVYLRARALRPGRRAGIDEEDLEVERLARRDVEERRLACVGGVVSRHCRSRNCGGQHAQCERGCCERGDIRGVPVSDKLWDRLAAWAELRGRFVP